MIAVVVDQYNGVVSLLLPLEWMEMNMRVREVEHKISRALPDPAIHRLQRPGISVFSFQRPLSTG